MPTRNNLQVPRPPLPLHSGHLGLLLAAGKLDGIIGQGVDRHVVKGKVTKVVSKVEEYKGDVLNSESWTATWSLSRFLTVTAKSVN